jgi:putative ABC transport system permease protein
MIKEYWVLAFRSLRHRGLRSWLTLLGIFIGVLAVVALIGLGNGLKAAVNAQFGISSTEVISVQAGGLNAFGPPGTGVTNPLTSKEVNAIKKINDVELAIVRNIVSGDLEYNDRKVFGSATNVPYGEERDFVYKVLEAETIKGKLLDDSDENKVVLGYNFYANNVDLGEPIEPGDKVVIKGKRFTVQGILEKKGSFIFDNIVLMNQDALNDLFEIEDTADIIAVKVDGKENIDKVKEDIEKVLRKERGVDEGEEDFEVSTPQAALETVNGILLGVQIFIVIIALISVFVGAIGIINTMTTSVVERRRDIGIMKAIGAKNSQIFNQFLVEAGLLGLIGGIAGATVGSGISALGTYGINSWLGTELVPNFDIPLIIITLIGSFLIGAISGIWPAMVAARQNPVEALRG